MNRAGCFKHTLFTQFLVRENALDKGGFRGWVFHAGMLFRATEKWWGDKAKRSAPHEGLDLCLYRNRRNRVVSLDVNVRIPVMYDGVVMKIIDDFLGKSIVVEHTLEGGNTTLLTIYGHTVPIRNLNVGRAVKEGKVVATLADPGTPSRGASPHLHISVFRNTGRASSEAFEWKNIDQPGLEMLNPLDALDGPYFLA